MRPTWDESFMLKAMVSAIRSSCLVRPVGAVLVRDKREVASGYNGAPPNVETCLETSVCFYQDLAYKDSLLGHGTYEDLKDKRKQFCVAAHAEINTFAQCSLLGISAAGCSLYITNFPCPGCVRDVIIPNKISEIVVWKDYLRNPAITLDELTMSELWLQRAGIKVRRLKFSETRIRELFVQLLMAGERTDYKFIPLTETVQK